MGMPKVLAGLGSLQQHRGMLWSVEKEQGHKYKDPASIIDDKKINTALEKTQAAAKDPDAIKAILQAAKDRSFLTNYTPGDPRCMQGSISVGYRAHWPCLRSQPLSNGAQHCDVD
jgi:hypothetical protein